MVPKDWPNNFDYRLCICQGLWDALFKEYMNASSQIRAPAPGRSPWHCRRPSVVTEGYIRLPPLPRTTSGQNVSTIIVVIYSVFCVWCSKTIVFYRVSGPLAAQNCTLAMLKNVGFSTVFALRGGKNRQKLSLKMFST